MSLPIKILKGHVVFPVRDPDKVRRVFPDVKISEIKGQFLCAVPHDLSATRFFANQGHPLPSPIATEYKWPGRFKPYEHQIDTAEFLTLNRRAYNLSGMGVGKTASALWATDYLKKVGEVDKTLIVAPLSTLDRVWAQEIFQILPHRRYHVLHGGRQKRLSLLEDRKADYYIINPDGVEIIADLLGSRPDINHIILDECFPAGTEISTPSGKKTIETLRINDIILSSWGPMPITHIFKKRATRLIRLHFEDGTHVDCTPEHPFATEKGWKAARETQNLRCLRDQDLPALRGYVRTSDPLLQQQSGEVLLEDVRNTIEDYWRDDARQGVRGVRKRILCAGGLGAFQAAALLFGKLCQKMGVGEQPKAAASPQENSGKTTRSPRVEQRNIWERLQEGDAPRGAQGKALGEPKRQWYRVDTRRSYVGTTHAERVYSVLRDLTRIAEDIRISDQLQSGLWASRTEDRGGSGRVQPQFSRAPRAGSEKRGEALGVRVVSIEDLECGGSQWVWNLEVAGPHDYIANGKVVHNCAVFRNSRTKRFKTMFHILNRQGIERSAWGLTGTPTPTAPTDCYGQIRLITPERYKSSFKSLQNELMWQVTQFKWAPKQGSAERVNELMKPSIRYALEDCIDLPPTIWQERECELSSEQKKHYEELRKKAFTEIDGTPISAVNAGVLLNKLVQAACGVLYDGQGGVVELDFGPRLSVLREVIEESSEKVIIFVPLTGVLNALYDQLKKDWTVEVIDGSVSAGKRNRVFKDFQSGQNPHILLAHPGTMAHGLTLTAATTICWFAPITSNELFQQANARIARPGQKNITNIVMIQGSPVERGLYTTLKERGKLQDLVLNLASGG